MNDIGGKGVNHGESPLYSKHYKLNLNFLYLVPPGSSKFTAFLLTFLRFKSLIFVYEII
jgi:hypothetical protein